MKRVLAFRLGINSDRPLVPTTCKLVRQTSCRRPWREWKHNCLTILAVSTKIEEPLLGLVRALAGIRIGSHSPLEELANAPHFRLSIHCLLRRPFGCSPAAGFRGSECWDRRL